MNVPVVGWTGSGDSITFTVNASNLGSEFTVGGTNDSLTAVSIKSISADNATDILPIALITTLLLVLMGGVVLRRRIG